MQWVDLQTHGDTPHRAFEALCSLLFERWCHREFPQRVTKIYVTGAGGDGGVESLARLDDGSAIGLQCKWFRDPLQRGQFAQIKSSLRRAAQHRAGLGRYIVAVPRNLADGIDKDDSKTERQRWDEFASQARSDFPTVTAELWDEATIERLLAEVGGRGVISYWFSHVVVDHNRLQRLFKQAKAGWLSNRYSPDLHQAGEIETEVELRLNRREIPVEWRRWCAGLRKRIGIAHLAITQLARIEEISDALSLSSAKDLIATLARYADDLAARLNGPAIPSVPVRLREPAFDLDDLRAFLSERCGDDRVRHHLEAIEDLAEEWAEQVVTLAQLDALAPPVVFVADAGAGKTHACAHIVERALARNEPAVLIRARDFAPESSTWTLILQRCLEETGLSLEELLDALVSSARHIDVQSAATNGGQETTHPCRVLVVIDGLDESASATAWSTRLAELPATIVHRPVTFVATCRPSMLRDYEKLSDLSLIEIAASDPDLDAVFAAYIKASRIDAPPAVRWWLRSPLEVRLFTDVFEGATRDALSRQSFRIHELIRRKLELIADAVAPTQRVSAETAAPLVTKKLVKFADALLRTGGPISHTDAIMCLRGSGADEFPNALAALETLRDRGILLEIPSTTVDPLEDTGPFWDFAFETLHSYVVASRYASAPCAESLPYLHQHPQALLFTIVLRENAGTTMLMAEDWCNGLLDSEVLELRLDAISLMEFSRATNYRNYVEERLVASMPTCRAVLSHLVIPGMRVPAYPFGARFVLNKIKDLPVATRDVFWSGPRELDSEYAPWSGSGVQALENETLRDVDAWDTAPLLLLMSAASVVEAHRREVVWSIARWAAEQPDGISRLLHLLFETFNDPQVLEDAVAAAWAAVCLRPTNDWKGVVETMRAARWGLAFPYVPTLRFIRYCELLISLVTKERSKLVIAIPPVLPMDVRVGGTVNKEIGYGPIRGDLTWYVVPRSVSDFERATEYGTEDAFDEWQWDQNREAILQAFVEGRIRAGSPEEAVDEGRRCIGLIAKVRAEPSSRSVSGALSGFAGAQTAKDKRSNEVTNGTEAAPDLEATSTAQSAVTSGAFNDMDVDDETADVDYEEGTDNVGLDESNDDMDDNGRRRANGLAGHSTQRDTPWSERLRELLRQHAHRHGLDALTLRALAYGYVMARAAEMGWSEAIEDADGAIQGAYGRATHGSRSEVCSFFEKYLWLALGELRAFLSFRLADADPKGRLAPSRMQDVDNPTDLMDTATVHVPLSRWDSLVAPVSLTEKWARERANEWVRLTSPVPIKEVAFFRGHDLHKSTANPDAFPEDAQWIAIHGYLHLREADSQADRDVWSSALLIQKEDIAIVEEDAAAGLLLSRHDLYDAHSGLARDGTYVGPFEALWMTDAEITTPMTHTTVVVHDGKLVIAEVPMYPAVVESHWKGPKERTFFYPSKVLRESLGITAYTNGCFLRSDGTVVAVHAKIAGANEWNDSEIGPPSGRWLLVRRDLLSEHLKSESALLIAMQARTEAADYLKKREVGWDCIEQRSVLLYDGIVDRIPIEEVHRLHLPMTGRESAVDAVESTLPHTADATNDEDETEER